LVVRERALGDLFGVGLLPIHLWRRRRGDVLGESAELRDAGQRAALQHATASARAWIADAAAVAAAASAVRRLERDRHGQPMIDPSTRTTTGLPSRHASRSTVPCPSPLPDSAALLALCLRCASSVYASGSTPASSLSSSSGSSGSLGSSPSSP